MLVTLFRLHDSELIKTSNILFELVDFVLPIDNEAKDRRGNAVVTIFELASASIRRTIGG